MRYQLLWLWIDHWVPLGIVPAANALPFGVVLRAANQNQSLAGGKRTAIIGGTACGGRGFYYTSSVICSYLANATFPKGEGFGALLVVR